MSEESKKNVTIYNYYYIINKDQGQFENIKSLLSTSNLFKSNIKDLYKISNTFQTKEFTDSEPVIKKEEIINEINFNINKENKSEIINEINFNINKEKKNKIIDKDINSESTKEITIEKKCEKEENNEFLSKKRFFNNDIKKRTGRKPKILGSISYHTKFSTDNILRKIKVKFFHKIINYLNSIIISKYRTKINTLKNLKGDISQNNTINFNKQLLNSKLKDIFLNNKINGKFKIYESSYNKTIIEKIYKENIQELIDILEITFLDAFKIFRDKNEVQKLNGLEKLDTVIEEIKSKDNNEDYIKKFREIAMNFENNYLNKEARK